MSSVQGTSIFRLALSIGFTLFAFIILIALGYWQAERLVWKRDLQAQIITRTQSPPLEIRGAADIAALTQDTHHYRRARLYGAFADKTLYWFTQIHNKPAALSERDKVGYHILQPFLLADGTAITIDRGFIPARLKDKPHTLPTPPSIEVILRWADKRTIFSGEDDLTQNTLYVRDTQIMARHWRLSLPSMLGEITTPNTTTPPYGNQSRLTLPNKHFGYMLTWFSLAGILVIISLLWHIRERKRA